MAAASFWVPDTHLGRWSSLRVLSSGGAAGTARPPFRARSIDGRDRLRELVVVESEVTDGRVTRLGWRWDRERRRWVRRTHPGKTALMKRPGRLEPRSDSPACRQLWNLEQLLA
jgi:hypothetical protein